MLDRKIIDSIKAERKMLNIQRLAGSRKIRSYNLAEHSYFVALMFQQLAEKYNVKYTMEDFSKILRHDFMEVFTTDLPWTAKNFSGNTKKAWASIEDEIGSHYRKVYNNVVTDEEMGSMSPEVYALFKYCDSMELMLFCIEECQMGNTSEDMRTVIRNCKKIGDTPCIQGFCFSEDLNEFILKCCETFCPTQYNIY